MDGDDVARPRRCVLELLAQGLCVTVNSDDPAYFGGYLAENFFALHDELGLSREQAERLVRNGFTASYLGEAERSRMLQQLDRYLAA